MRLVRRRAPGVPLWGGAVIVPYASGRRWTLYGTNCIHVLNSDLIPADASVIGDPPYGMDNETDSTRFSGGQSKNNRHEGQGRDDYAIVHGDREPFDPSPWLNFPRVVLWGSNHFAARLPVGTTLIWIKKGAHLFGTFLSDAEVAWMKGGHGVYCHEVWFPPPTRAVEAGDPGGSPAHPNQKPIGLLEWCMTRSRVPPDGVVFDGWAGSGSCGVAALRTGRSYIGCEIEPTYLPIIARRLAQAEADGVQGNMFAARPCTTRPTG